ncbi:MAG: hypothetical protein HQL74_03100 [Magnetococcales bacterium]|nr:hypothetical protein [Magnetococcales bacterium]
MMRGKIWAGTVLAVASLLGAASSQADNLVVLEAKGGKLQVGQVVDSTTTLSLAAKESAAFVSETGRIIRLKGPYSGPVVTAGDTTTGGVKEALAALTTGSKTKDQSQLGATRSMTTDKGGNKLPDPWMIDVTQGGSYCYREGGSLVLWRADAKSDTVVGVTLDKKRWKAHTDWPKGEANLQLPPDVPFKDGSRMDLEVGKRKIETNLHMIPKAVTAVPAQVAWMHAKGCKRQFAALLDTVTSGDAKP